MIAAIYARKSTSRTPATTPRAWSVNPFHMGHHFGSHTQQTGAQGWLRILRQGWNQLLARNLPEATNVWSFSLRSWRQRSL